MADGMTLQGMYDLQDIVLRGASPPTNLYMALITDVGAGENTPDKDTATMADLTEIAEGNGYSAGGYQLDRNSTDFESLAKGTSDAVATIKDITFTASGGAIPPSGNGATYAVLTTDEATVANRKVWYWWQLSEERTATDGQDLKLQNARTKLQEVA